MSLRRNTLWNISGSGLPLVAAVAFIPYCLKQLGSEAFGILTLVWALIGYFSLFDFGVGRALTFEIAKLKSKDAQIEVSSLMRAGLFLTLLSGFLGALVMWCLAPYLAENWLNISTSFQDDAKQAFQLASLGIVFATLSSGLRGVQEGLEQFRASNVNRIVMGVCTFSFPALAILIHGPELGLIVIYLVAARLGVLILNLFQLKKFLVGQAGLTGQKFKSLLAFGSWVTVSGVVGPLMVYGDRFFVSAAVGANFLPLYAIPQEGLQRLLMIPGAFCSALLPRLSALDPDAKKNLFLKSYKRLALGMFGVCFLAAVLAHPVLSIWLSPDFASEAIHLVIILIIGIWINSVSMVPYTFLHAMGNARLTAMFHLLELLIYVVGLFYLVHALGLVGAAVAWVMRVAIDWILLHRSVMNTLKC
jgi:O-antigen/teichoic acid export membrane protein